MQRCQNPCNPVLQFPESVGTKIAQAANIEWNNLIFDLDGLKTRLLWNDYSVFGQILKQ